jgi:macrolide-specific efflux system membrane fusion protein
VCSSDLTVLARIDKLALNSALANANAQLASANSALATANEQLTAAQESGSETATAQAQVTAKARAVDVARDNYQTARNNLDSAELVAEYDGLVTEVNIAVGDAVGASGAGGAGGTGSTRSDIAIINTDQWQLTVNVSEADVRQLSVGNQVEISGNTLAETAFGTVSEIALLPVASGQNVAFPVTVAITGTPNGLFDGVSMTAKIIYERRMNVMTVPAAAVTTAADGTRTVEVLAADGSITPVTITTGATSGQNLEVLTGLDGSETLQYTQITIERPSGSENRGGNGSPGGGQMPDFTQMPSGGQMPDFSQLPGGAGMTRPGGRG